VHEHCNGKLKKSQRRQIYQKRKNGEPEEKGGRGGFANGKTVFREGAGNGVKKRGG